MCECNLRFTSDGCMVEKMLNAVMSERCHFSADYSTPLRQKQTRCRLNHGHGHCCQFENQTTANQPLHEAGGE